MKNIKSVIVIILTIIYSSAYAQEELKKKVIETHNGVLEIKIYAKLQTQIYKVDNIKDSRIEIYSNKGDLSIFQLDYYDREFSIEYTESYRRLMQKSNSRRKYEELETYSDERFIKIYTTDLESVKAAMSSVITIEDKFDYNNLSLRASSSGRIYIREIENIDVEGELNITASSSGRIELSNLNVADDLNINTSSTGRLNIKSLKLGQNMYVTASSSGKVYVKEPISVTNGETVLNVSSSGYVEISDLHTANCLTLKASSGGKIYTKNVNAENNTSVVAGSSGKITTLNFSSGNTLTATATSSGRFSLDTLAINNGVLIAKCSSNGRIYTKYGEVKSADLYNELTASSSGYINCKEILMSKAKVSATSSGDIFVNVSKELNIKYISSGGYIGYKKKNPMFSITGAGIPGLKPID